MVNKLTSGYLAKLKREATKRKRTQTILHSEALDQIAVEHGCENWSLLSKLVNKPFYRMSDEQAIVDFKDIKIDIRSEESILAAKKAYPGQGVGPIVTSRIFDIICNLGGHPTNPFLLPVNPDNKYILKLLSGTFPDDEGWMILVDGPGINGAGSNSTKRMEDHVKAGGRFFHYVRTGQDGNIEFLEPQYMWPNQYKITPGS